MWRNTKRYRFFAAVLSGILLIELIAFIVVIGIAGRKAYGWVSLLLFFLTIATCFFFVWFFVAYFNVKRREKIRLMQNRYLFGKVVRYYNRQDLEDRVNFLLHKRRHKKEERYAVSFAGVAPLFPGAEQSAKPLQQYSLRTIEYLDHQFLPTQHDKADFVILYGFGNGEFFLYFFGLERTQVRKVLDDISNELFNISNNYKLHLFVFPTFGIEPVKDGEKPIESFENAAIARKKARKDVEIRKFYQPEFRKSKNESDEQVILEAFKNHEFVVYYQGKFNLHTNRYCSSEALIRWNTKEHGLLTPSQFLKRVEDAGLIHELDRFVLEQVLKDLNAVKKKGRRVLPVSRNFSLYEFYSPKFIDILDERLKKYRISPELIQIEITETTSQANPFISISIIQRLKEKGIKVLRDNFGIGFSNIANLSHIPLDIRKLDKSFVDNIVSDPKAREVCRVLIELGRASGKRVIAEGADSEPQVRLLRQFGCDEIQGYYFAKPRSSENFNKLLTNNPFENEKEEDE